MCVRAAPSLPSCLGRVLHTFIHTVVRMYRHTNTHPHALACMHPHTHTHTHTHTWQVLNLASQFAGNLRMDDLEFTTRTYSSVTAYMQYVCVFVCVRAFVRACVRACIHVHTRAHTHTHTHTHRSKQADRMLTWTWARRLAPFGVQVYFFDARVLPSGWARKGCPFVLAHCLVSASRWCCGGRFVGSCHFRCLNHQTRAHTHMHARTHTRTHTHTCVRARRSTPCTPERF